MKAADNFPCSSGYALKVAKANAVLSRVLGAPFNKGFEFPITADKVFRYVVSERFPESAIHPIFS
jgi:hypothetical protein